MIYAKVTGQHIDVCADPVYSDCVNFLSLKLEFSKEWNGYETTAIFKGNNGKNISAILDEESGFYIGDNTFIVPYEVIKAPCFTFSLIGTKEGSRITTNAAKVVVNESGYAQGDVPSEPTLSEYEQMISLYQSALNIAQGVRDDADNGIFKGDKGEKGDKGDKGDKGERGDKGEKGETGTQGQRGEAFKYSDFTTEQLESLKGEKGDKGDKGDPAVLSEAKLSEADDYSITYSGFRFEKALAGTSTYLKMNGEAGITVNVTGKNIARPLMTSFEEHKGLFFFPKEDGGIEIIGTATETSYIPLTENIVVNPSENGLNYYQFASTVNGEDIVYAVFEGIDGEKHIKKVGDGISLNDEVLSIGRLCAYVEKGKEYDLIVYLQVELGHCATEFEPYEKFVMIEFEEEDWPYRAIKSFTFPKNGTYTMIDEDVPGLSFTPLPYLKESGVYVTNEEFKDGMNSVKGYIEETLLGGSW